MKGDLLDQLQAAGLGAASPLYTKFADGIRSLLRHKLDGADPEEGVGTVLETVAVAIRERRIRTLDQLPSQIRAAVNSYVHQARAAGALRARSYSNELPQILTDLSPEARAILFRRYAQSQTDEQISREMSIPFETVVSIRTEIRRHILDTIRAKIGKSDS